MIVFPQAAIDFAREINDANLPDLCTVTLPGSWFSDGEGGGSYGEGESYSFPCRTWPLTAREIETLVADQLREPGLEGLVMPYGTELPNEATVTVTRHDTGAVTSYEVKGRIPDPTYAMMSRAIIKRAELQEPEEPEDES